MQLDKAVREWARNSMWGRHRGGAALVLSPHTYRYPLPLNGHSFSWLRGMSRLSESLKDTCGSQGTQISSSATFVPNASLLNLDYRRRDCRCCAIPNNLPQEQKVQLSTLSTRIQLLQRWTRLLIATWSRCTCHLTSR